MKAQRFTATGRLTLLVDDGIVLVAATGVIGSSSAALLADRLHEACEVCIGVLAVDLSACTYLSDDAVDVLVETSGRPSRGRYRIQITAAHRDITETLDAAGLPHLGGGPAHDRTETHRRTAGLDDARQAGMAG